MPFDRKKFKSLVHYVCWKAKDDPTRLGATKLNKICWLADFTNYYRTAHSITGATYVKRQFGPVPRAILHTISELEQEKAIAAVSGQQFGNFAQKQFRALEPPDLSAFTEDEITVVDKITEYVCNKHTASSISDLSHDHIWHSAADGEEIPYFTVFSVPGEITETEREWGLMTISELRP